MSSEAWVGLPTKLDLARRFDIRYPDLSRRGWRAQMRRRFGYFSPESWYQAVVDRLVISGCRWLDVGGGKAVFPDNPDLSAELAKRCGLLVGVDPSVNIERNPFVHERAQCTIEEYESEHRFDVVTLRMVAEHIPEPDRAASALARLVTPGGKVVVYTPNRFSAASLVAAAVPNRLHHRLVNLFWSVAEEDVFPTCYRMNTRNRLRNVFEHAGFREIAFTRLDDCCFSQRYRAMHFIELSLWWLFSHMRLTYAENDLLGIYAKR